MRATRDLAKGCALCEGAIRKGEIYESEDGFRAHRECRRNLLAWRQQRNGPSAGPSPSRPMSGQAAPKEGDFVVGEQARARCLDADGNEWVGVPGNFPGVVAEWRWLQPDSAGPYHVHMGKLAIGRTRMQQIVPGEVEAAAQMLASRLSGGVIDGPRLITEGRDCAGEFDLGQADDPLLYLSTIGIIVMNAEHQAAEHVRHLTVVTDTDIRRIMSSRE